MNWMSALEGYVAKYAHVESVFAYLNDGFTNLTSGNHGPWSRLRAENGVTFMSSSFAFVMVVL